MTVHRESVRAALGKLERYMQARIGNVHAPETTGNSSPFQSQQYATSVCRSELAVRLYGFGYEIERGKHGQPEIRGYTQE